MHETVSCAPAAGKGGRAFARPAGPPSAPSRLSYPFDPDPRFLPEMIREGRLKEVDGKVVKQLIRFWRPRNDRQPYWCWTSKEAVAERIGRHPRTVQRSFDRLGRAGVIEQQAVSVPDPDAPQNRTGWRIVLLWIAPPGYKPGEGPARPGKGAKKGSVQAPSVSPPQEPFVSPPQEPSVSPPQEALTAVWGETPVSPPGETPVSPNKRAGASNWSERENSEKAIDRTCAREGEEIGGPVETAEVPTEGRTPPATVAAPADVRAEVLSPGRVILERLYNGAEDGVREGDWGRSEDWYHSVARDLAKGVGSEALLDACLFLASRKGVDHRGRKFSALWKSVREGRPSKQIRKYLDDLNRRASTASQPSLNAPPARPSSHPGARPAFEGVSPPVPSGSLSPARPSGSPAAGPPPKPAPPVRPVADPLPAPWDGKIGPPAKPEPEPVREDPSRRTPTQRQWVESLAPDRRAQFEAWTDAERIEFLTRFATSFDEKFAAVIAEEPLDMLRPRGPRPRGRVRR